MGPMIRLELDGVRHHVLHAFASYNADMERRVNDALKEALEGFDFDRAVAAEVTVCLKETVKLAIQRAVRDVFDEKPVREAVADAVRIAIAKGEQEH